MIDGIDMEISGEYQEYRPETIDEIYKIADNYNTFHRLPHTYHDSEFRAFYRGQSNSVWEISPSASRVKYDERSMYLESEKDIKGDTLFSQVAYLQHYREKKGYGTRFIDFSTNIDIAMFFACRENDNYEKDGAVFICSYGEHKSKCIDTVIFSELVTAEDGIVDVKDFAKTICSKHSKEVDEYIRENYNAPDFNERSVIIIEHLLMTFLDYGYMVRPDDEENSKNIRMKRQEGCFYICGVEFCRDITRINRYHSQTQRQFKSHSYKVPGDLKNGSRLVKCLISKELKPVILEHLRNKGINNNYLMI